MKSTYGKLCTRFTFLGVLVAGQAQAALTLTINEFTTDVLNFTISGTFDTATTGDAAGYFGIKNDYVNNVGVHTELFTTIPTVDLDTILVDGVSPSRFIEGTATTPIYGDSVYWENPAGSNVPFPAGAAISGQVILSGVGAFDPGSLVTLDLVSGGTQTIWDRVEFSATSPIPESSSLGLLMLASCGFVSCRRRKTSMS